MGTRAKLIVGGLIGAGIIAAIAGTAKASESTPEPTPGPTPGPTNAWPSDGMPWNIYSATTLNRQRQYNAAVIAANTSLEEDPPLFGRPYLTEDGILGPDTCTQLSYWQSWGGPNMPIACRVGNI